VQRTRQRAGADGQMRVLAAAHVAQPTVRPVYVRDQLGLGEVLVEQTFQRVPSLE
jgi:hypothetical protein